MALWKPDKLTSLKAWYKADAITGLSNGDPVSVWGNSASSAFDLSSSGADRPEYISSGQNSLPVVRFVNNTLNSGNVALLNNVQGSLLAAVAKFSSSPGTGANRDDIIGLTFTSNTTSYRALLSAGTTANKHTSGGRRVASNAFANAASTANLSVGPFFIHLSRIDYTSGSVAQFINGTQDGTATIGSTGNSASENSDDIKMGRFSSTVGVFTGDIAEALIFESALSTADRELLEGYLAWKWGLEGNLPAGHPYKSAAPTVGDVSNRRRREISGGLL